MSNKNSYIMENNTIKQLLMWVFSLQFSIEQKVDFNTVESETFEHNCGFEYKDNKGDWHDVYMNVYGTIHKQQEKSEYHNPFPEFGGAGELQGGEVSILDWCFDEVEVFSSTEKAPFKMTFQDLYYCANNKIEL